MEKDKEWYDYIYRVSSEYRKEPEDSRYYSIWDYALGLIGDERVIDLGCGSGQFGRLLLKNEKSFVLGIDFSGYAISIARHLNPEFSHKFIVGDILRDFPTKEYDLATCFEVLEHIEKDREVIERIDQGKRFIFSVPNYDYHSHVRKFNSKEEIIKRYSDLLEIRHICGFVMHDDHIIYLVDSVRK